MKLRIKDNSIRLRLTQTEVRNIEKGNIVEACVPFGKYMPPFCYSLAPEEGVAGPDVRYTDHHLCILLPLAQARHWASSDLISIENVLMLDDGRTLHLLVEKDFQCLHKRPDEEEHDHFPHPAAEAS